MIEKVIWPIYISSIVLHKIGILLWRILSAGRLPCHQIFLPWGPLWRPLRSAWWGRNRRTGRAPQHKRQICSDDRCVIKTFILIRGAERLASTDYCLCCSSVRLSACPFVLQITLTILLFHRNESVCQWNRLVRQTSNLQIFKILMPITLNLSNQKKWSWKTTLEFSQKYKTNIK